MLVHKNPTILHDYNPTSPSKKMFFFFYTHDSMIFGYNNCFFFKKPWVVLVFPHWSCPLMCPWLSPSVTSAPRLWRAEGPTGPGNPSRDERWFPCALHRKRNDSAFRRLRSAPKRIEQFLQDVDAVYLIISSFPTFPYPNWLFMAPLVLKHPKRFTMVYPTSRARWPMKLPASSMTMVHWSHPLLKNAQMVPKKGIDSIFNDFKKNSRWISKFIQKMYDFKNI